MTQPSNSDKENSGKLEEVRLYIFGQEYYVRSGKNPEYTKRLAEYIDSTMNHIAENSKIVDSQRIAILSLLYIADELFRERESGGGVEAELDATADRILQLLDDSLKSADVQSKAD